jgi:hypothetical protein
VLLHEGRGMGATWKRWRCCCNGWTALGYRTVLPEALEPPMTPLPQTLGEAA